MFFFVRPAFALPRASGPPRLLVHAASAHVVFGEQDLFFEDCTVPPDRVVEGFLDTVDQTAGLLAVHCRAGLGRTGTLIALWMMKVLSLRGGTFLLFV